MKEEIKQYLTSMYSEEDINDLIDDEVINWVDDDWNDDYDTEYDWYLDHNNSEAESVIYNQLKQEVKQHFKCSLSDFELRELIVDLYPNLD